MAQVTKEQRAQFGINGTPTTARKAYVRDMAFDHDGQNKNADGTTTNKIDTKSWILVREDGRRCHLNTYDGKVGTRVDPDQFTYDALDEKGMAKKLKIGKPNGYREVPVTDCPFATPVVDAANPNPAISFPAGEETEPVISPLASTELPVETPAPQTEEPKVEAPKAETPAPQAQGGRRGRRQ